MKYVALVASFLFCFVFLLDRVVAFCQRIYHSSFLRRRAFVEENTKAAHGKVYTFYTSHLLLFLMSLTKFV